MYRALVPRIAIVPDPDLRVSIVRIYSFANAFLLKLTLHNTLVDERDELLFRLASASTRQTEASPLDLGDILAAEDVLAIGLSPYEALNQRLKRVKEQTNDIAKQIEDAISFLETEVPRITRRIACVVESLAKVRQG